MTSGRSIDDKVQSLLASTLRKFSEYRSLQHQNKQWTAVAAEAGHAGWQLMELVRGNALQLETHRLLTRKLPFIEDDIPPYVHTLICQHGDDAIPLIEELLMRSDLDFGSYEVARVLNLLAGWATNTSKVLPRPPGVEYSPEKVQYLWLDAPRELNPQKVAAVARRLLDIVKLTESQESKRDRKSYEALTQRHPELLDSNKYRPYEDVYKDFPEYEFEASRYSATVAGLLALAHRVSSNDAIPRRYGWCLAQDQLFSGLHMFYGLLTPSQTRDILGAILNLADGKGGFLAQSRKIDEAWEHFRYFRERPETDEGRTAGEWLY